MCQNQSSVRDKRQLTIPRHEHGTVPQLLNLTYDEVTTLISRLIDSDGPRIEKSGPLAVINCTSGPNAIDRRLLLIVGWLSFVVTI
jgi:hypothetical protein